MTNKFRQDFIVILQTGALTFDRQYNKTIASGVVATGLKIPDSLFNEKDYDVQAYVNDILDFEYGLFDAAGEDYPTWVKKYFNWKTKHKIL